MLDYNKKVMIGVCEGGRGSLLHDKELAEPIELTLREKNDLALVGGQT